MTQKNSIEYSTTFDTIEIVERLSCNATPSTDHQDNWLRGIILPAILVVLYAVLSAIIVFQR